MTGVTIDSETLDRITVLGLKQWREITSHEAEHAAHQLDRDAGKLRTAAIDILLAYLEP